MATKDNKGLHLRLDTRVAVPRRLGSFVAGRGAGDGVCSSSNRTSDSFCMARLAAPATMRSVPVRSTAISACDTTSGTTMKPVSWYCLICCGLNMLAPVLAASVSGDCRQGVNW